MFLSDTHRLQGRQNKEALRGQSKAGCTCSIPSPMVLVGPTRALSEREPVLQWGELLVNLCERLKDKPLQFLTIPQLQLFRSLHMWIGEADTNCAQAKLINHLAEMRKTFASNILRMSAALGS